MSKRIIAVLVCTLLALVAATVWVPVREGYWHETGRSWLGPDSPAPVPGPFVPREPLLPPRYVWTWEQMRPQRRSDMGPDVPDLFDEERVSWTVVFLEQALILLIGGGLLTFLIRHDRRRRADSVSSA